ncbi:MAG: sporulation protein YunB [Clostridia bacterium]
MRMSINPTYEREGRLSFLGVLLIIFIAIAGIIILINVKVRPFIISVAKGYAKNEVNNSLNHIIDEALRTEEYNFINIKEDSEGKIAAATMNSTDINLFMTKISIGLKNKIADMEPIEAKIPIGNFFPSPFLTGIGPRIKVKFLILSNTNIKVTENFLARGINQTLYTISFHIETVVGIYIPTMHSAVTVENEIPISRTLIVGTVPDTYTNVEGLEGTMQDAIMNLD